MPRDSSSSDERNEGSTTTNVVDSSHPYYIHPSDYPGMNLVGALFDGRSYGGWRRAVIIALSAKNKLGFIDGSLTVPAVDLMLQKAWERCNNMVLSWLLNSLSKEIAESVLYSHSAQLLWSDLEDRFGQANGAKLFQLQKELNALTQGNLSISTYFTKMKSLWDELDAMNTFSACVCECKCGAKEKTVKAHQDERLLQFLMGLNETFIGVRSNILLSSPLPTIGQAYSLVIQDEKQREIHATPNYPGESSSFMATNQHPRRFNDHKNQKLAYDTKKTTVYCNYCKKPGHTIDKCYKIHGFPADFKFTKQRMFQNNIQSNNAISSADDSQQSGGNSEAKFLNQDNISQLLQLLEQVKMNQQAAGSTENAANLTCAGMTKFFFSNACIFNVDNRSWIIDSGATEHMTFNRSLFTNLKAFSEPIVDLSLRNPQVFGREQGGLYILKPNQPAISSSFPKAVSSCLSSSSFNLPKDQSICISNSVFVFSVFSSVFDPSVKEKLWHYR
ncbi:uncharacterized protein LOC129884029 [Solanum dulcamara]|uniref:uncharacterized protein LOC129884029 n=1 Tax=Solanum dulcamara TaxID=45834 RepID=UPI00248657EB|nr:uncharacterized protein LOC129884029 [Solanum dulcamara]